jgi:predicted SprT family Zn-dependent metalloprotease
MGNVSKNARAGSTTHKFMCSCGGEVKMKSIFDKGKLRNLAYCDKCDRTERRPKDFK